MMNVEQVIKSYIVEKVLFGDGGRLQDDVPFHESGILDSTGYMEIIMFMEERFGITVADDEVIPDNFDTLRQMSDFVQRKLGVRTAAWHAAQNVPDQDS